MALRPGDSVLHRAFGSGTVLEADGGVCIEFRQHGVKRISLSPPYDVLLLEVRGEPYVPSPRFRQEIALLAGPHPEDTPRAKEHPEYPVESKQRDRTLDGLATYIASLRDRIDEGREIDDWSTIVLRSRNAGVMARYQRAHETTPYFARIDFRERGRIAPEMHYLGAFGFSLGSVTVTDWKAPIASVFYRSAGHATGYRAPNGAVLGDLLLKRRFSLRAGVLYEISDEVDHRHTTAATKSTGDEQDFLRDQLAGRATARLREIVATIQSEQYALIEAPPAQVLIVQGAAGSGKTTIALHRLAYLLYPGNAQGIDASRCVVFGPNRMYLSSIAAVLPTLGVDNIVQTTPARWALERMGLADRELTDSCLEAILSTELTREQKAEQYQRSRVKTSAAVARVLDRYVEHLRAQVAFPADGWRLTRLGEAEVAFEITRPQLQQASDATRRLPFARQREAFIERVLLPLRDTYEDRVTRRVRELGEPARPLYEQAVKREDDAKRIEEVIGNLQVSAAAPAVDQSSLISSLDASAQALRDQARDLRQEAERQLLAPNRMSERALTREGRNWAFAEARSQVERLAASAGWALFDVLRGLNGLWSDRDLLAHCAGTLPSDQRDLLPTGLPAGGAIDVSDLPALHYLYTLVDPPTAPPFDHVIVDEAQDLSELELVTLRRFSRNGSFTLLGDLAQSIHGYRGLSMWERVVALLTGERITRHNVQRSYRTTQEITTLANRVLRSIGRLRPGLGILDAEPFPRHGPAPTRATFQNDDQLVAAVQAALAEIARGGHQNVAVITKTLARSNWLTGALKQGAGGGDLQTALTEDFRYAGGTVVLPVHLAKGMEFDATIVVDASNAYYSATEFDARLLYVALTRAMHELHVFAVGAMSPHLREASDDLPF